MPEIPYEAFGRSRTLFENGLKGRWPFHLFLYQPYQFPGTPCFGGGAGADVPEPRFRISILQLLEQVFAPDVYIRLRKGLP